MADEITKLSRDMLEKPGIYLPEETVIEKELDKKFKKLSEKQQKDLANIMFEIMLISTMQSHQNNILGRDYIQKILPQIMKEVEIQAKSYNSKLVWALTIVGGIIQIGANAIGAYGIGNAIATHGVQAATNFIGSINANVAAGNAVGELLKGVGGLEKERQQGPREIRAYSIEEKKRLQRLNQDLSSSAANKESEHLRTMQQIMDAKFRISGIVLGQQS